MFLVPKVYFFLLTGQKKQECIPKIVVMAQTLHSLKATQALGQAVKVLHFNSYPLVLNPIELKKTFSSLKQRKRLKLPAIHIQCGLYKMKYADKSIKTV